MDELERILGFWQKFYYVTPFAILCQFAAIVSGVRYFKKEKIHILFVIYAFSGFVLIIIINFFVIALDIQGKNRTLIIESINILFAFVEYLVFYYFFQKVIRSTVAKKIMKIFFVLFTVTILHFFWKETDPTFPRISVRYYSDLIISAGLLFLASICMIYYFELFQKKSATNPVQSPVFWIVNGLFFYCILIVPFFLISTKLLAMQKESYFILFAVHYVFFGLLYLALAKAFLCKKPLTT